MSKVKRVVLGKGMLVATMNDDMVGLRHPTNVFDQVVLLSNNGIVGKRGRLVFEITEPKRKRRGTT